MIEKVIEVSAWVIAIILFVIFVPKKKYNKAILGFLFMEVLSRPLGYIIAEWRLIDYPIRFFDYATRSSFTFEYFIFPVVSAIYVVKYPRKSSKFTKLAYSLLVVSLLTAAEVILEKYTNLIEYQQWKWYFSWSSMLVTLYIAYRLTRWFVKFSKSSNESSPVG